MASLLVENLPIECPSDKPNAYDNGARCCASRFTESGGPLHR